MRLNYSPEKIREVRQKQAGPILDDFKKWLDKKAVMTPPQGPLGKAVFYTLNQWQKLLG